MNNPLNLCEILKGHEGETFWSDVFNLVTLMSVKNDFIKIRWGVIEINLYPDGTHNKYFGVAQCAVAYADALIAELNKKKQQ